MKKVLALVLAVMMMATVAFAAGTLEADGTIKNPGKDNTTESWTVRPGKTIEINAGGIQAVDGSYKFQDSGYTPGTDKLLKNINSTNYSISNVKYDDGRTLVKGVEFNDKENRVEVKLNDNWELTSNKKLDMTFTLKGKKAGKTKPADIKIHIVQDVHFKLQEFVKDAAGNVVTPAVLQINADNELDMGSYVFDENTIYKVHQYDDKTTYGTLTFTAQGDDDVDVEVRVYDGDKLYLYNENDADNTILRAYADTDADITFLTFTGSPTFNSTATVRFYKEEDSHIYGLNNGQLTNVNAKWDDDEGCFILKARTLGAYVFSDKALSVSATTPGTNNPDTGANDVVGIAGALAAVALVSAAAVSLKK